MKAESKLLLRNFDFQSSFEDWKQNEAAEELSCLKEFYEELLLRQSSNHTLAEKGNGYQAILWIDLDLLEFNPSYLIDFLKPKVIALGYYSYLSDYKEEFLDGGKKVVYERHYLKPLQGIKPNQKHSLNFGNITLENCIVNGVGSQLKIMSGRYPGIKFQSFEKLMKVLLT